MSLTLNAFRVIRKNFVLGPVGLELGAERIALLGLNGAGKSTLLQALAGLLPHGGGLAVDGERVPHLPPRRTGYVPQSASFPPFVSARDCVTAALHLKDVSPQLVNDRAALALDAVGLTGEASNRASRLSGGQAKRLSIAQAIAHQPSFLLLDEPTAGLDPLQRQAVRRVLLAQPRGTTAIVTTHILEDIAEWAERVIVLSRGELVGDLDMHDVAAADRLAFLEGRVRDLGGGDA